MVLKINFRYVHKNNISDLVQMQGENLIISNVQFFKFQLIPYYSMSLVEFSFSIFSKFKFYLYLDYIILFYFLSMSI